MIHAILNGDFGHALETLLAVSILILVVLMVRRAVSRQFGAGIVYMLWAIPVVRFFLPPMPTPVSIIDLGFGAPAAEPALRAAVAQPGGEQTGWVVHGAADRFEVAGPPAAAAPAETIEPAAPFWNEELLQMLVLAGIAVWIAGAMVFAARTLLSHARFMQIVDREAMPVSARVQDLVRQIAAETGLKRPPRIVASLISRGPFVTGLFRPVVVMPAWFEDDYTPAEARAALAHEFMHVRRGDLWALQVSELFVAAMWFNPLAYIARDAFRTDQEAACDADVLARCQTSPHAYGSTLVKAAKLHLPEPAYANGRLPLTHALKERLTRMTYPAPSSRRRLIGFGAALVFGVSTLAITSSVAAAGEPKEDGAHETRIVSKGLWIEGDSDRQIVLLSDPMSKVMPNPGLPPRAAEIQARIQADVQEMTGPEVMGAVIDLSTDEDFIEIGRLSAELAALGAELGIEGALGSLNVNFSGMSEEEIEAWAEEFEAKMEFRSDELEARAAEMEIRIQKHADRIEARVDHDAEKHVAVIEKRIEAHAAELEKIMEDHFGPEFEARVEAQAAVVEGLVEDCEDAKLAKGETKILERKDVDGETVRLACVEGDREALKSEKVLAIVRNHPGMTDAERAAFREAADGKRKTNVFVIRDDGHSVEIKAPHAPGAPDAPDAPKPHKVHIKKIEKTKEAPAAPDAPEAPEAPISPDLDGE